MSSQILPAYFLLKLSNMLVHSLFCFVVFSSVFFLQLWDVCTHCCGKGKKKVSENFAIFTIFPALLLETFFSKVSLFFCFDFGIFKSNLQ